MFNLILNAFFSLFQLSTIPSPLGRVKIFASFTVKCWDNLEVESEEWMRTSENGKIDNGKVK